MSEPWDFFYALYLDVDRPHAPLLAGKASSPLQEGITWVQSDNFPLRLYFRKRAAIASTSVSVSVPESLSITLGGRAINNGVITGPLLIIQQTWTEGADGGDAYYEATLNLHTSELDALMDAASGAVTLQVDVEVGNRLTFVVPVRIIPEAYKGEADPAPTLNPLAPKVINGNLAVYNADTDTWVSLQLVGPNNQPLWTEIPNA